MLLQGFDGLEARLADDEKELRCFALEHVDQLKLTSYRLSIV
jgi:hypothetical protein